MAKLKLDLANLKVQSFETTTTGFGLRSTVFGQSVEPSVGCDTSEGCPVSEQATCTPGTPTCDGVAGSTLECYETCDSTCSNSYATCGTCFTYGACPGNTECWTCNCE